MKAAGITLSTIGTGGGSADILRRLAEQSGGRYYEAPDATSIPDIFLKETIRTAGEQIVEEPFQPIPSAPSEILRGLDAGRLPQLLGYNATTAKGTATVALLTGREDPLLAQWQYGLGRSVAWTSDTRQQWATPWIGTEEFGTLVAQLVAWTLPPQDEQGIDVSFSPGRNGDLNVQVTSFDDDGSPRNFFRTVLRLVGPDLTPLQALLTQVGPARSGLRIPAPTWCGWPRPATALSRRVERWGSCRPPPRSSAASAWTARRSPTTPPRARAASWNSTRPPPMRRRPSCWTGSGPTTSRPTPFRPRSGPGC
jgi:hypothetical protein